MDQSGEHKGAEPKMLHQRTAKLLLYGSQFRSRRAPADSFHCRFEVPLDFHPVCFQEVPWRNVGPKWYAWLITNRKSTFQQPKHREGSKIMVALTIQLPIPLVSHESTQKSKIKKFANCSFLFDSPQRQSILQQTRVHVFNCSYRFI